MDERPALVEEIEGILRRYLHAHPQAVDTERGIHEWWLHDGSRTYTLADVHAAIEALVATGELSERRLPDGQSIYANADAPPSDQS
jgi:hypothetical protein